jgi:hypothetical protein
MLAGIIAEEVSFTTFPDRSYVHQVPICLPRSNSPLRISEPSVRYQDHAPCISPFSRKPVCLIPPLP